jgi:hypothetical protein
MLHSFVPLAHWVRADWDFIALLMPKTTHVAIQGDV